MTGVHSQVLGRACKKAGIMGGLATFILSDEPYIGFILIIRYSNYPLEL